MLQCCSTLIYSKHRSANDLWVATENGGFSTWEAQGFFFRSSFHGSSTTSLFVKDLEYFLGEMFKISGVVYFYIVFPVERVLSWDDNVISTCLWSTSLRLVVATFGGWPYLPHPLNIVLHVGRETLFTEVYLRTTLGPYFVTSYDLLNYHLCDAMRGSGTAEWFPS